MNEWQVKQVWRDLGLKFNLLFRGGQLLEDRCVKSGKGIIVEFQELVIWTKPSARQGKGEATGTTNPWRAHSRSQQKG